MAYTPVPIINSIPADDTQFAAIPTRALPARVDRISFNRAVTNGVDPEWGAIVGSIGAGMTVNQTGGNLVITAGTTARSETIIRSTRSYEGGIRLRAQSILSQRVVNNNFFVELVDVIGDALAYTIVSATVIDVTFASGHGFTTADNVGQSMILGGFSGTGTFLTGRYPILSVTGNIVRFTVAGFAAGTGTCSVFGWNYYQLQYQSTVATNLSFDTQRRGYNSGQTTATINTTASPGHIAIVTGNDVLCTLADQLVASATTIQQTIRANRSVNVPDDFPLRTQIRIANGATAPTATTWTIGLVSVSNYANQDVVIQDIRPMGVASALPVEVLRSSTVTVAGTVTANIASITAGANLIGDVGVQYRANATGAGLPLNLDSPATPVVRIIKATAGRLIAIYAVNSNAATRFLKVFNAVAPTLGTTAAILDIAIPPNSAEPIFISVEGGIGFATAITVAITGARGVTDNTSITLNDVTGFTVHQ